MTLRTRAGAAVRWTSVSALITTLTEAVRVVIVSRSVEPEELGLMSMAYAAIEVAQAFSDAGISGAIIHKRELTRHQLSSLYWLNVAVGAALLCLLWLALPVIVYAFRDQRLESLIRCMACVFVISPVGLQFELLLRKELSFDIIALVDAIASLCMLAVVAVGSLLGWGVWLLVFAFIARSTAKTACLAAIGLKRFRPTLHFALADVREVLSFGLYQLAERSVRAIFQRSDQILVGVVVGARALGFYTFAVNLTSRPQATLNPVVTRVAFPVLASLQTEPERLSNAFLRMVYLLTLANAPVFAGITMVASTLIPVIFGPKWIPAVPLVQLLCLVNFLRSVANPQSSLQLAKGRADLGFKWSVVTAVITLPATYLGGLTGEAIGVAAALSVAEVILFIAAYWMVLRPLTGSCAAKYLKTVIVPVSCAAVMCAGISISPHVVGQPMQLAVDIVIGGLTYLGIVWLTDRSVVRDVIAIAIPPRVTV